MSVTESSLLVAILADGPPDAVARENTSSGELIRILRESLALETVPGAAMLALNEPATAAAATVIFGVVGSVGVDTIFFT